MNRVLREAALAPLKLHNRNAIAPMFQLSSLASEMDDWHLMYVGMLALLGKPPAIPS